MGAQPSLPIWEVCDRWEQAVFEQEQRLLAQQQRTLLDSHPRRSNARQLNPWKMNVWVQNLVQRFTDLDVSGNPELRSLTPERQHQFIDGLIHSLSSYQQDLSAASAVGPVLSAPRREPSQAAGPAQISGMDTPLDPTVPAENVPVPRLGSGT